MKNLNKTAHPSAVSVGDITSLQGGFTKRERACIDLRLPQSGDEELDALIAEANHRDMMTEIAKARMISFPTSTFEQALNYAANAISEL